MAAAAIAARAAVERRRIKKEKERAEAIARGEILPEEVVRPAKKVFHFPNKWQDTEKWSNPCIRGYLTRFTKRAYQLAKSDFFNLFIIGVILAAGVVVGFQTFPVNDAAYLCETVAPGRFGRCTESAIVKKNHVFRQWCDDWAVKVAEYKYEFSQENITSFCGSREEVYGKAEAPQYPGVAIIETIDYIILGIFGFECILKIVAGGVAFWNYWTSHDWKWNNFDFIVVVLCLPIWGDTFRRKFCRSLAAHAAHAGHEACEEDTPTADDCYGPRRPKINRLHS